RCRPARAARGGRRRRAAQHGRVSSAIRLSRSPGRRPDSRPAARSHGRAGGRSVRPQHRQPGQPPAQEDRGGSQEPGTDQDALGRRLQLRRRGEPGMKWYWTQSLTSQLIGLMLLALAVSQGISFLIYWDERGQALRQAAKEEFLVRTASVARLLEATPAVYHPDILRAVDTTYTRFWLTMESPDRVAAWQRDAWRRLGTPLPVAASPARRTSPTLSAEASEVEASIVVPEPGAAASSAWSTLPAHAWPLARIARFMRLDDAYGSGLAVQLRDGTWLNAAFAKPSLGSAWTSQSTVSLGITALVLSFIAILAARRIARPLRRIAVAAEA